jgi:RNA polymerase sigma-70 factor, ECF subfamily
VLLSKPSADPPPPPAAPVFRVVFEMESSYVYNTLRRLGVRERDLEDLTHEVFVVVHRRLSEYDPRRSLRPWLFGIAFRVASEHRRLAHHRREVAGEPDQEAVDGAQLADERIASEQDRRLCLEALDDLELDRRAVLVLHDIDGLTMPEIARALSIPLNTAYSRLRLAREQFRGAVRRLRPQRGEP